MSNEPQGASLFETDIPFEHLVSLTGADAPLLLDLVYAQADHPENIFGVALYRSNAPFLLHKALADVVLRVAVNLNARYGWTLVLKDGLRTVEAQQAVFDTDVVRAHPEWTQGPQRMFAHPGGGGHPRGMAVDVAALDHQGAAVDFGTVFDAMPGPDGINPASRTHGDFGTPVRSAQVLINRAWLTQAFLDAGVDAGVPIWPLPHEWWDFRLMPEEYARYAPVSEGDLPPMWRLLP